MFLLFLFSHRFSPLLNVLLVIFVVFKNVSYFNQVDQKSFPASRFNCGLKRIVREKKPLTFEVTQSQIKINTIRVFI